MTAFFKILRDGINISTLIALGIFLFYGSNNEYLLLPLLPLCFGLIVNLIIFPVLKEKQSITIVIFIITAWARYVVLPTLLNIWPIYDFALYSPLNYNLLPSASCFMIYELTVISLFIRYYGNTLKGKLLSLPSPIDSAPKSEGYVIYLLFALAGLFILVFIPQSRDGLNFLRLEAASGERFGENEISTFIIFLRQLVVTSLGCAMVTAVCIFHKKQKVSYFGLVILLIIAFVNIATIIGEQRSSQIYSSFACIFVLCKFFPKYKKLTIGTLVSSAFIVLLLLTLYKHFYIFQMDSYSSVLVEANFDGEELTRNLEIYLLGPLTVNSVFDFYEQSSFNLFFSRMIFDILRPFIGISFLVKEFPIDTTTILYNLFVTKGRFGNGFLLPISCHAYLYFGYVLSPILICFFYYCALKLEFLIRNTRSVLICFWGGYFYIRIASCMIAANVYTVITSFSLVLIFTAGIYILQKVIDQSTVNRNQNDNAF